MGEVLSSWSPRILSVLRIVTGFLFLWHGSQKLFSYPTPLPAGVEGPLILVAGILEFFGGIVFLIGLFTRPIAFILSGLMAAAYFMGHASGGFLPFVNQGELAVLYCFIFFYFIFSGGGEWAADNLIWRQN
jgi:putative oxidoreductase